MLFVLCWQIGKNQTYIYMFWHLLLRTHQKISVKLGEVNGTWDKQPKKRLPTCGVYIYDPPPTHYSPVVKLWTWSLREATVAPWTWCSVLLLQWCAEEMFASTHAWSRKHAAPEELPRSTEQNTVHRCRMVEDRRRGIFPSWCPRFPILRSTFLKTAGSILHVVSTVMPFSIQTQVFTGARVKKTLALWMRSADRVYPLSFCPGQCTETVALPVPSTRHSTQDRRAPGVLWVETSMMSRTVEPIQATRWWKCWQMLVTCCMKTRNTQCTRWSPVTCATNRRCAVSCFRLRLRLLPPEGEGIINHRPAVHDVSYARVQWMHIIHDTFLQCCWFSAEPDTVVCSTASDTMSHGIWSSSTAT